MATPEEIARINWGDPANWAQLTRETRAQASRTIQSLRENAPGWDLLSAWWISAGQAVGQFQRRKRTVLIAVESLGEKLQDAPEWFTEARQIILNAGDTLTMGDAELTNEIEERRVKVAQIAAAYGELFEGLAGMREGLTEGTTRKAWRQVEAEAARSRPGDIRTAWNIEWGGGWPWGLILAAGAAILIFTRKR